jgi:hypothetical protein
MALYVCIKKWKKRSREGKVQSPTHSGKKTIVKNEVKNVLLAWLVKVLHSTFYTKWATNTIWIVIKDNKYENKITKTSTFIFMSLFISQKQKFSGENYLSVAALVVFFI